MTYKNTYNLQNSQALTNLFIKFHCICIIIYTLTYEKPFFQYFERQKNTTETGILMIML